MVPLKWQPAEFKIHTRRFCSFVFSSFVKKRILSEGKVHIMQLSRFKICPELSKAWNTAG